MNQKGQESAVFEFIVVAIMGLFIMVIVLSIVNYFSDLRIQASEKTFNDAFRSSVNSPNGAVIAAKNIFLQPGAKTSVALSSQASGVPPECIEIDAVPFGSLELSSTGDRVIISKSIEITVYFSCVLGPKYGNGTDCEKSCKVSFGKEITP